MDRRQWQRSYGRELSPCDERLREPSSPAARILVGQAYSERKDQGGMSVARKKGASSGDARLKPKRGNLVGDGPGGARQSLVEGGRTRARLAGLPVIPSSGAQHGERSSVERRPPGGAAVGLSNADLVTLALYSLGGTVERVDTEDVATRVNELAPGRLVWRKYPNQINLELVRVYLSDLKKPAKGAYVIGAGRTGWMLTQRGRARAVHLSESSLPGFASRRANTAATQRERAERAWLLGHPALEILRASGAKALSPRDLESLFRVDEYILGAVRERRIARVLNAVADDPALVTLLSSAAGRVRSLRGR